MNNETSRGYMDILEELRECSEYHSINGHQVMADIMKRAAKEIESLRAELIGEES